MLRLDHVSRRYDDVVALEDLSFEVRPGEVLGLLGPNGAGKTTAMRVVMGVTDVDAGSATWRDHPIGAADRHRFGYMPEERGLYPRMKLGPQLDYFGRLHGLDRRTARAATTTWLERVGLGDRAGSRVDELSHGNQQRAQLLSALVFDPEVLVLDEPFSGLDPTGADMLGALMLERAGDGVAVVFSSHQLDLVEQFCERVVIVDHGRVVLEGRVRELEEDRAAHRLRVRVEPATDPDWYTTVPGVRLDSRDESGALLALGDGADAQAILRAAQAAGPVLHFGFERPRLSDLFREAVAA